MSVHSERNKLTLTIKNTNSRAILFYQPAYYCRCHKIGPQTSFLKPILLSEKWQRWKAKEKNIFLVPKSAWNKVSWEAPPVSKYISRHQSDEERNHYSKYFASIHKPAHSTKWQLFCILYSIQKLAKMRLIWQRVNKP